MCVLLEAVVSDYPLSPLLLLGTPLLGQVLIELALLPQDAIHSGALGNSAE